MELDNTLTAAEALALCLDQTQPEHITQLASVGSKIHLAAVAGLVEIELPYHLRPSVKAVLQGKGYHVRQVSGRGGNFTTIDFEGSIDAVIREYKEANKE